MFEGKAQADVIKQWQRARGEMAKSMDDYIFHLRDAGDALVVENDKLQKTLSDVRFLIDDAMALGETESIPAWLANRLTEIQNKLEAKVNG